MTTVLNLPTPTIAANDIERRIGYPPTTPPSPRIANLTSTCIRQHAQLLSPQAAYRILPISHIKGKETHLVKGPVLASSKVAMALKACTSAVLFVITIGRLSEETASDLMMQGRSLEGLILDAIGSYAVEQAADSFQAELERLLARDGQMTGLRFSPGYCDWDITEQRKIFSAIDAKRIGVVLTDSYLMVPRKSLSGVFGIGATEIIKAKPNPCEECGVEDCRERRAPRKKLKLGMVQFLL